MNGCKPAGRSAKALLAEPIALTGNAALGAARSAHASTYIFGAICPGDGKGAALVLPACNTEAMNLHLAEIAAEVAPGKHAVLAQQPARLARIGFLSAGWPDFAGRNFDVCRRELQGLGYSEGRDVVFEYRLAEGDLDRLPKLASELASLKPDVIVASPTPAAVAARKATQTIPIVMVNVGDPERLGLVTSLARPGGNVTGLAFSVGLETLGKGLAGC